jgi:hypothetical protein
MDDGFDGLASVASPLPHAIRTSTPIQTDANSAATEILTPNLANRTGVREVDFIILGVAVVPPHVRANLSVLAGTARVLDDRSARLHDL